MTNRHNNNLSSENHIIVERHYIPRQLYEQWYRPNFFNSGSPNSLHIPNETINNITQPPTTQPSTTSSNSDNFSYFTQRFDSLNNPTSSGSGTLSNGIRYSYENYDLPNNPNHPFNTQNTTNSTNTTTANDINSTNTANTTHTTTTNSTNTANTNRRLPVSRSLFRLFASPEIITNYNNGNTNNTENTEETRNSLDDAFLNYFTELLGTTRNRRTQSVGLTMDEINASTVRTNFNMDTDHEISSCPICVGPYNNNDEISTIINCEHQFHTNCLNTWLRNHNTCPLCRTNVLVNNNNNNNDNQQEAGIDSLD